jgi:hypothetical protein
MLCDKICQGLVVGRWFSPGTPVSAINNTDRGVPDENTSKSNENKPNYKKTTVLCYTTAMNYHRMYKFSLILKMKIHHVWPHMPLLPSIY